MNREIGDAPLNWSVLTGAVLLASLAACGGGGDNNASALPSAAQMASTCASLKGQTVAGVTITDTKRFEASTVTGGTALCKVSATRAPFLDIEVDVPDNWSGRLFHQGGGGFDGRIPTALTTDGTGALTDVHPAIASKGAVFAASNGGNRATVPAQAGPGVWASGTADGKASEEDYAYKALGTTIKFAKAVTNSFFSAAPKKTYFNGCSNGGRNAYIVAQRWPGEYDGIVSGCETMNMTGQTSAWTRVGSRAGTAAALTVAQYKAAYASAVAACDAADGQTDGYLTNPGACTFDPALLVCGLPTANADPALCLNSGQVDTLKMLMSDVKLADGTVIYSKFNWSDFSGFGPAFGILGGAYVMIATDDPAWLTATKQATFDVDQMYDAIGFGLLSKGVDHDKASIAAFVASGKKLITWHASGDNLLSPNDHVRNYATMTQMVRDLGVADPSTNTRQFMVPTPTHGAGQGPKEVDWVSAIIDWVENGKAPEQLTYTFTQAGATSARSVPVCLAPKAPKYVSGDASVATSYRCE